MVCYEVLDIAGSISLPGNAYNRPLHAGDEKTNFALELTYNYGKDGPDAYNIGLFCNH